jgi:hypothetical protein
MQNAVRTLGWWACLLALAAACTTAKDPGPVTAGATVHPTLATTQAPAVQMTPTPLQPGQAAVYTPLEVTLKQSEFSLEYITEYGPSRVPPQGQKFLWLHLELKNTGERDSAVPASEHFSVLYATQEYKAAYGHRKAYPDYMALSPQIYPGQTLGAWLRFDVPQAAELSEVWFAFLPESSQIDFSFSSERYGWAVHPVYLWRLGP